MVSDIIGNIKSKRSFFFEKIVFGLLVSCLVLSHDTEYFSLDIPRKTTSWIISICSTIWVQVYGNPSLTTNIRIYIFLDKTYFTNCLSTSFLFWIPVFFFFLRIFYLSPSPLYPTSPHQLPHYFWTSSLPIIFDFFVFWAFNLLTASILLPSCYLRLVVLWMLWMMVAVYMANFTLWQTSIMFIV